MLMDIKTGSIEKKEKHSKPKKTNEQKRIIAAHIAMYCMSAALMSTFPGFIVKNNYDNDIRELDNKQNAIYEQFMTCEEFSDSFKAEFTKISDDYANGVISYEEFDEKVKHLNSVKYAQEVLASSNNTELKSQVEVIDKQKQARTEKYQSNPIVDAGLIGLVGIGSASIGSMIASTVYGVKDMAEESRKNKLLTNTPEVIEPFKKKNNVKQRKIELSIEYDETLDSISIKTEEQENQNTL
ncbi:MAG: hypothetical protein IJ371_02095 [Clostridia bacterium]|nr:hypothetical protein [Clostridia bacterium]